MIFNLKETPRSTSTSYKRILNLKETTQKTTITINPDLGNQIPKSIDLVKTPRLPTQKHHDQPQPHRSVKINLTKTKITLT